MTRLLLAAISIITLTSCLSFNSGSTYLETTVKITNEAQNSGGSGTIILSSSDSSYVLTNAHVCDVARYGGRVIKESGASFSVESYRKSKTHDLCLIRVAANLGANVEVAAENAYLLETSIVSGHPGLLPIVKTEGHFSGREIITIMTDIRACEESDYKDPVLGILCTMLGGRLPVFKNYDAQLVTNLIMPGSSGSGVYNSVGQLTAVIFAGQRGLGYGFVVPYEYVIRFLLNDSDKGEVIYPSFSLLGVRSQEVTHEKFRKTFEKACKQFSSAKTPELCKLLQESY